MPSGTNTDTDASTVFTQAGDLDKKTGKMSTCEATIQTPMFGAIQVQLPDTWGVGPSYPDDDQTICSVYGPKNTRIDLKRYSTAFDEGDEATCLLAQLFTSETPYAPVTQSESVIVDSVQSLKHELQDLINEA